MTKPGFIFLFILSFHYSFAQSDVASLYDSARLSGDLELAKKVISLAKDQNNKKVLANSYYLMAYLQEAEEAYYDAVSYYFEALGVYRELKFKKETADVIENIANIYHLTGFHDTALQYYYDALELKTALNDRNGVTQLNSSIGLQYHKLNRQAEALDFYNRAIQNSLEQNNYSHLHWIYNHLGKLYREMESFSKAEIAYQKSLKFANNINDESGVYNNIGYLYLMMQDTVSARKNFTLALKLTSGKDTLKSKFTGKIYSNLASIYESEKSDSAYAYYQKSYDFFKDHPLRMSEQYFGVCKKLKSLSQEQGKLKLALTYSEDIDKLTADLLALRVQLNELYNRYQVEAATYKFQHQEKAKALERQLVIDHYIKWALTTVVLVMILLSFILYRKNRKIRFAKDTARKIYQVINS